MSEQMVKQALEAFIAEAKLAGVDIEEVAQNAKAGIMGNEIYSWAPTLEKSRSVKFLEDAVNDVCNTLKNR